MSITADSPALAADFTATPDATPANDSGKVAKLGAAGKIHVGFLTGYAMGNYGADAGGDDTYAITFASGPTAYTAGDQYIFKAATGNTGAATLDANGLGAKNIMRLSNSGSAVNLMTGDIIAGRPVHVIYDGTQFILLNAPPVANGGQSSRTTGAGTGNLDIAHGLTCKPSFIEIFGVQTRSPSGSNSMTSKGSCNVLANTQTSTCISAQSAGTPVATQDATHIMNITDSGGQQVLASITVANVDDTNFRLNFATMAGATVYFEWVARA